MSHGTSQLMPRLDALEIGAMLYRRQKRGASSTIRDMLRWWSQWPWRLCRTQFALTVVNVARVQKGQSTAQPFTFPPIGLSPGTLENRNEVLDARGRELTGEDVHEKTPFMFRAIVRAARAGRKPWPPPPPRRGYPKD
jgi:hypothetical protein